MVKTLQRADRGSTYRHYRPTTRRLGQIFYKRTLHGNKLAVHIVVADTVALHRAESTGADMESHLAALHTEGIKLLQQLGE